jgi:hypothetical protein
MGAEALVAPSLAWLFGSYPAALALERGPRFALAAAVAAAPFIIFPLPLRGVGLVALAYTVTWLAVVVGHAWQFACSRRRSRAAGLTVLVVVRESPRLAAWLHRRHGLPLPPRPCVCSVHVDPIWRPPGDLAPTLAAQAFGRQYRHDYDALLSGLRGFPVLVASSTFNRHESSWTASGMAAGWSRQRPGPLFASAPLRHRPDARARQQRKMFGDVISARRTDRPDAWRTRVFDCLARGAARQNAQVWLELPHHLRGGPAG